MYKQTVIHECLQALRENNKKFTREIDNLIVDEEEAVKGYDKAILLFNDSSVPNRESFVETLQHIKDEELEHIRELNKMKEALSSIESSD